MHHLCATIWLNSMDLPRYKFSKESQPALLEFLKVVAETCPPNVSDTEELWKHVLPVDEELQHQINSFRNTNTISETIEIIDSDNEKIETAIPVKKSHNKDFMLPEQSFTQLTLDETKRNVSVSDYFVDNIQELLETESSISNDVIKQLRSECTKGHLEKVFVVLASNLNSECIINLWRSICSADSEEWEIISKYFFEYTVTQMIVNGSDEKLKMLFKEIYGNFRNFSDKLIEVLLKLLLEHGTNCSNWISIKNCFMYVSTNHKNILLSEFIKQCTKFEEQHLDVYLSLLTKDLNPHSVDDSLLTSLNKLVDLMCEVANEYETNKNFGKLLLEFIPILAFNDSNQIDKIKHVIATHTSVYKSLLTKEFNGVLMRQNGFSQTFEKIVQ